MPTYRLIDGSGSRVEHAARVFDHCLAWDVFVLGIPFDPALQEYVIETQQALTGDQAEHVEVELVP